MKQVTVATEGDIVIATVEIDVDIANAETIAALVLSGVPNDAIGLVIDLSKARYLDSAGVRMLFRVVRELDACRQRTAVALDEDSPLRQILKITNFDEVAYVCASHDECASGLRSGLTGGL